MSSTAAAVSAHPSPVRARVCVRDADKDVLFLITQYLRDLGLSTTVVALLRESGLDPFWLCGPSREVALLREWVLQGEWASVRALLTPLRVVLTDESCAVAVALVEKQALMEEFFLKSTADSRRREILDELQSHRAHSAVRLTRLEMQRCLRVLKGDQQSDWSLDDARLSCFESLVPLFRDEIADEDDESKYVRMPHRQLAALLSDALLLHQQSQHTPRGHVLGLGDLVSLTPRSTAALKKSAEDEEDEESLSSLQLTEPCERRRGESRDALSQSVNGLRGFGSKEVVAHMVVEGRRHRKQNPLVMSMDFSRDRSGGRREDDHATLRRIAGERIKEEDEAQEEDPEEDKEEREAEEGVDAATQTDVVVDEAPRASVGQAEASTATDEQQALRKSSLSTRGDIRKSLRNSMSNQTETTTSERREIASSAPILVTAVAVEQVEDDTREGSVLLSKSSDLEPGTPFRCGSQSHYDGEKQSNVSEPEDPEDDDQDTTHGDVEDDEPTPLRSYSQLTIDSVVRAHVVAQVREAQASRALDISPDGSEMVIGTNARALRVFDLSEPLVTAAASSSHSSFLPLLPVSMEKHKHHSSSIYVAAYNHVDPDHASPLIATGAAESSIKVLSRWTQQELWIRGHSGKCRALQFVSPHVLCSAASGDLLIRAWDLDTSDGSQPTCVQRFDGHVGEIQALATYQSGRADSRCLVSSSMDKTVRLWDLRSAQCARVLTRTASPAFTLAFQPLGETTNVLATGHQDGSVALWDIRASSKKLSSISHHHDECRAVSWSPDGRWLLSASFDGTLCLMEAASGSQELTAVASFHQHDDKVLQAQWHPTQPAILTTGADKLIKLWGFA